MSNHSIDELNRETDARFWLQTGFKPGQKLDRSNPSDKAMVKTWLDIFAKVKKQDEAGILRLTYGMPLVQNAILSAAAAIGNVISNLTAAASTTDPMAQKRHVQAAAQAHNESQQAAKRGAAQQPPTVSPKVVAASAHDALVASGAQIERAVNDVLGHLGMDHPANGPAAQPSSPALTMTSPPTGAPQPPTTIADHVALTQTQAAPGVAVDVHAQAAPKFPDKKPDDGKKGFFAEHAEVLAIGGAITVGGIIAMFASGKKKPRRASRAHHHHARAR